ncbi:hypothetical protein E6H15_03720 [Candidatus Bathyarchaeota archaeon]|nr:MAG: hypothetical protein E6H15_03720 [Candidatus Bathyarchaeota archaeon]
MSQQEMQPATSRRFSLRSMLLLVLLVGVGAGATAYVLGSPLQPPTALQQPVRLNRAPPLQRARLPPLTIAP